MEKKNLSLHVTNTSPFSFLFISIALWIDMITGIDAPVGTLRR